jgi:hypothetical protein
MEYLGAWGTLIHEKKLRSKISCQTPFTGKRSDHWNFSFFELKENATARIVPSPIMEEFKRKLLETCRYEYLDKIGAN